MLEKTINEWEEIYELKILDPDGFDRTDPKLYERTFDKEAFEKGLMFSTIEFSMKAVDDPVIMIFKVYDYDNNWCAFDKIEDAFEMFKVEVECEIDNTRIGIDYMRKSTFENLPEYSG